MADSQQRQGDDLFIVDNSDSDWKVRDYLREWSEISRAFDIATGYFEIGALLALDGKWQQLEKLRILMGDEVSKRTKKALLAGIENVGKILDASLEKEKDKNDFLNGVPAIVEAIRERKIECRVYAKEKFHAKAYITHSKLAVVGSAALVGSSNLTYPGITNNVELNVQLRREVPVLQEWFERHWNEAEDVSDEILKVIERHTRDYLPFEIYAKALQEFFRNHEITTGEWELLQSKMFPVLDQYQKEGYQALIKIANTYRGAFLCDGVGLGKTFIGMMVIERLIMHDRKRVMLLVPKAARKPVWEAALKRYLLRDRSSGRGLCRNHGRVEPHGFASEEVRNARRLHEERLSNHRNLARPVVPSLWLSVRHQRASPEGLQTILRVLEALTSSTPHPGFNMPFRYRLHAALP